MDLPPKGLRGNKTHSAAEAAADARRIAERAAARAATMEDLAATQSQPPKPTEHTWQTMGRGNRPATQQAPPAPGTGFIKQAQRHNAGAARGRATSRSATPTPRGVTPCGQGGGRLRRHPRPLSTQVPPWRPARAGAPPKAAPLPPWAENLSAADRDEMLADDLAAQEARIEEQAEAERQAVRAKHKERMDLKFKKAEAARKATMPP